MYLIQSKMLARNVLSSLAFVLYRSFAFRTHQCTGSTWSGGTPCSNSRQLRAKLQWKGFCGMVHPWTQWKVSTKLASIAATAAKMVCPKPAQFDVAVLNLCVGVTGYVTGIW